MIVKIFRIGGTLCPAQGARVVAQLKDQGLSAAPNSPRKSYRDDPTERCRATNVAAPQNPSDGANPAVRATRRPRWPRSAWARCRGRGRRHLHDGKSETRRVRVRICGIEAAERRLRSRRLRAFEHDRGKGRPLPAGGRALCAMVVLMGIRASRIGGCASCR